MPMPLPKKAEERQLQHANLLTLAFFRKARERGVMCDPASFHRWLCELMSLKSQVGPAPAKTLTSIAARAHNLENRSKERILCEAAKKVYELLLHLEDTFTGSGKVASLAAELCAVYYDVLVDFPEVSFLDVANSAKTLEN